MIEHLHLLIPGGPSRGDVRRNRFEKLARDVLAQPLFMEQLSHTAAIIRSLQAGLNSGAHYSVASRVDSSEAKRLWVALRDLISKVREVLDAPAVS